MTALPLNRLSVARSRVVVPPLDWVLVGCAALIMTMGTLLVWSATATNDVLTGERHVTTAWGRDYGDVPPVEGIIFTTGKAHQMEVAVDVVRLPTPGASGSA